jgi:hypothetical protein
MCLSKSLLFLIENTMLTSLQMWPIFLILSNDVFYSDDATMEMHSFKIYHFYGLHS